MWIDLKQYESYIHCSPPTANMQDTRAVKEIEYIDAHTSPFSVVVKHSSARADEFHVGITDSNGHVYNFDERGCVVDRAKSSGDRRVGVEINGHCGESCKRDGRLEEEEKYSEGDNLWRHSLVCVQALFRPHHDPPQLPRGQLEYERANAMSENSWEKLARQWDDGLRGVHAAWHSIAWVMWGRDELPLHLV